MSDLVTLRFSRAVVTYTDSFEVIIQGPLWPREMQAALEIIGLYKDQHKETNRRLKESPVNEDI